MIFIFIQDMMTVEMYRQSFYKKPMREKMISFSDRLEALVDSGEMEPLMIREANSTERARLTAIWNQDYLLYENEKNFMKLDDVLEISKRARWFDDAIWELKDSSR